MSGLKIVGGAFNGVFSSSTAATSPSSLQTEYLKEPGLGRIGKLLNCLDCLIRPQLRAVLALALVAHLVPVDVIGQGGAFVSRICSTFLFV